ARGVDPRAAAETLDAPQHAGAGQPRLMGPVDDLGVERPVLVGVVLAEVDGQPPRGSVQGHGRAPSRWASWRRNWCSARPVTQPPAPAVSAMTAVPAR